MTKNPWLEELQQVIDLLSGTSIVELELQDGDLRIAIKRGAAAAPRPLVPGPSEAQEGFAYITAPLLGTFYRQATPGAKPFIREGDQVEKGQVVALIEAMKIFNEIQAEVSGRVHAILVEDGVLVEADQRLIAIRVEEEDTG